MHETIEKVVTTTHELRIDSHHLMEKTQKTLNHTKGIDKTLTLVHSRSIDDKSYKVKKVQIHRVDCGRLRLTWSYVSPQVETDMMEDEVKKFEEDWTNLWDPEISQVVTDMSMTEDEVKKFEEDWTNLWDPDHDI